MLKTAKILILILILIPIIIPVGVLAETNFIVCNGPDCTFGHLLLLVKNVLDWLVMISFSAAIITFIWAGFLLLTTGVVDKKTQAKAYARLTILEEQGPDLKRPYADIVQDKIRELRIQFSKTNVRILYFFFHKNKIILLHAFKKKDWAVHPQEIETARERMNDWIARNKQWRQGHD